MDGAVNHPTAMNDDATNSALFPPEIYSVFEFALVSRPQGSPRQSVKNVAEFESIEEAFATALALARREATILTHVFASLSSAEGEPPVTILSTEWGYDVRHDHQTLTRFWVHSRAKSP
jgi:hypothetical protein